MGYAMLYAPCWACHRPFFSNHNYVPTMPDEQGEKWPVCRDCMEQANAKRKAAGLEPHFIHPEAYEPAPEFD